MSHNIDRSNGRYNMAFRGSRNDIWHRHGQQMEAGMTIDQWAAEAGLDWEAVKVPALADLSAFNIDVAGSIRNGNVRTVDTGMFFNARSDNGAIISGALSDRHQNVQPRDVLDWFDRYIKVDDRFSLDVAGSLKGGALIWATATFDGDMDVAGEKHLARVLMSTTFDASGATINQATMTRAVCNNTLNICHGDKRAMVKTRHATTFKAEHVSKELATLASSFTRFKKIGDAMAQAEMAREQVADFFKDVLSIPRDAAQEDISTRKQNQYLELAAAYRTSIAEGAEKDTAWSALQAVTRYVDHERSARGAGVSEDAARFTSAQFGSGNGLKGKAMELLMPRIKDRVLIDA